MSDLLVDGLTFVFPVGSQAWKYDEWAFYRSQFATMRRGIKAVDLLVAGPDSTAWLVEVKDYRVNARTKPSDLSAELQQKVFDTLAALLPASINANDAAEKQAASKILAARKLRVVLHLEQPAKRSRLRPDAISPVSICQQLRRLLKPIDAHPVVASHDAMNQVPWSVR